MKHLLFIKNLNSEDDVKKIEEAFADSRIDYEIILKDKCIAIMGRNDLVRAAKTLLAEYGYIVD